jgi:hypothetical protein
VIGYRASVTAPSTENEAVSHSVNLPEPAHVVEDRHHLEVVHERREVGAESNAS